jgi:O-antigen/teichoic acid export membrane protein
MQVWWAAWLIGTVASADLRAAQILFGPARVITFFLGTVLPIRFARTLAEGGPVALHRKVYNAYLLIVPMCGVYCLLLAIFPEVLLRLIYGHAYASPEAATVLKLYSLCAFLSYLQMVIVAALTAGRQTRSIFLGSVWGCGVALLASPVSILMFGSRGAIISMIVTLLVVTALYLVTYFENLKNPPLSQPLSNRSAEEASS